MDRRRTTMGRRKVTLPEEELSPLRAQLFAWRASRTGRSPLPTEIWASAVALAQRHGLCPVARALGLTTAPSKPRWDVPGDGPPRSNPLSWNWPPPEVRLREQPSKSPPPMVRGCASGWRPARAGTPPTLSRPSWRAALDPGCRIDPDPGGGRAGGTWTPGPARYVRWANSRPASA